MPSPVICRVLDGHNLPVHGIYIVAHCFGQRHAILESSTDSDGFAGIWFPKGQDDALGFIYPEDFSLLMLTFMVPRLEIPPQAPWPIHARTPLEPMHEHCVTLYLKDSYTYQLEFASLPMELSSPEEDAGPVVVSAV